MDDRRLDDILQRLDRVERYLEDHSAWHEEEHERRGEGGGGCGCRCHERRHEHHHDHGHHEHRHDEGGERRDRGEGGRGRSDGFEEKRIVDLIVRLVAEKVDELLGKYEQRRAAQAAQGDAADPPAPAGSNQG